MDTDSRNTASGTASFEFGTIVSRENWTNSRVPAYDMYFNNAQFRNLK